MKRIAVEWLKSSYSDLVVIEEILHNNFLTHMVAFHSQQSIEKSLKAIIAFEDINVTKIHSLNRLFKTVEDYIKLDDFEMVNKLDKLYIDSRYPADIGILPNGKPIPADAKEFYEFAKFIFDHACKILNVERSELL
jgi:HEPN domain-containing protein